MKAAMLGWARVIADTDKAVLCELDEIGGEQWVPRSVIHEDSQIERDDEKDAEGELIVAAWWAEREGLV
jgi:hypothetical protein